MPNRSWVRALAALAVTAGALLAPPAANAAFPYPDTPTGVIAAPSGSTSIAVRWNASPQPDIRGYFVFTKLTASPSWSYLTYTTDTSYVHSGLTSGQSRQYYVKAIDELERESGSSSAATATVGTDANPATPTGLAASGGAGKISLKWNASGEADRKGYFLFTKLSSSSTWSYLGYSDKPRYVHTGLSSGQTRNYYVKAVDLGNLESGTSANATATVATDTTAPGAPTAVTATPGDGEVGVSWTAPTSADVEKYYVFAKAGSGGTWYWRGASDTTAFVDKYRDNTRTYYYYVKAVDTSNNESTPSTATSTVPTIKHLQIGVVGNIGDRSPEEFTTTTFMEIHEDLGSPDVRASWEITKDPASLSSVFADFDSRGIRPLVLGEFSDFIPSTATVEDFCGGIAEAYGPGGTAGMSDETAVRYIEFGNEPAFAEQPYVRSHPAAYADRLVDCATAATAANPNVGVLAAADDPSGLGWVDALFTAVPGLDAIIAGWTVHPYGPIPDSDDRLDQVMNDTHDNGSDLPVFATEFGIPTDDTNPIDELYGWPVPPTLPATTATPVDYSHAGDEMQLLVHHWATDYPRLQEAMWYQTADQQDPGVTSDAHAYFGLVTNAKTPKGGLYTDFAGLVPLGVVP